MKRTGRQKDIVTPEKKQEQRELLRLFSANIRKILKNTDLLADDLQEIRLRTGAPLLVVAKDQEYFLTPDGALTGEWEKGYPVSPTDIRDTMDYIGSFSLYAYEDELRQGFLTVEGGHRIGIGRFRFRGRGGRRRCRRPQHGFGQPVSGQRQQTAQHEQHGTEQKKGTFHSSPSRTGSFVWASVAGTRGEKAQISSSS